MKVSIIMPVYNREAYVREAIDSILHQTMPDLELIVIDDCSEDHTAEIVRSIHDERIRFVPNPFKSTLPLLRNEGISLAKGDYIGYMDSDDIAACDRLEKEVADVRGLSGDSAPFPVERERHQQTHTGPDQDLHG